MTFLATIPTLSFCLGVATAAFTFAFPFAPASLTGVANFAASPAILRERIDVHRRRPFLRVQVVVAMTLTLTVDAYLLEKQLCSRKPVRVQSHVFAESVWKHTLDRSHLHVFIHLPVLAIRRLARLVPSQELLPTLDASEKVF